MLLLRIIFGVLLLAVTYESTTDAHKVINVGCKVNDPAANRGAPHNVTSRNIQMDAMTDRCTHEGCSCYLSFDTIVNLTSNTVINIIDDVVLSSTFILANFANISLFGHNGPTIRCNQSAGGELRFVSCHNCTIENICWDGCGTQTVDHVIHPVLLFRYSSNIKIQNCSFKNSVGQAIVLSEARGDVIINYCKFVNNNYLYRGYGAAIYYT